METIKVEEIEVIFNRIADKLKFEVGNGELHFQSDLYRLIPTEKWDNFENTEVAIGSLKDDVREIKKLTNDPERPCI